MHDGRHGVAPTLISIEKQEALDQLIRRDSTESHDDRLMGRYCSNVIIAFDSWDIEPCGWTGVDIRRYGSQRWSRGLNDNLGMSARSDKNPTHPDQRAACGFFLAFQPDSADKTRLCSNSVSDELHGSETTLPDRPAATPLTTRGAWQYGA